jgi:hypothetical protein
MSTDFSREYNRFTIPGLLQTPDFIRLVISMAELDVQR